MTDLVEAFNLDMSAVGHLTSAVQFGFIFGTLIFALLTIADRFSPSKVFFVCGIIGSLFNLATILDNQTMYSLIAIRFCTGFFLAGIYPVGMKIAADYYKKGLGLSLGYLVGALVVGTAFPHFLKAFNTNINWQNLLVFPRAAPVAARLLKPVLPQRYPGPAAVRCAQVYYVPVLPQTSQ